MPGLLLELKPLLLAEHVWLTGVAPTVCHIGPYPDPVHTLAGTILLTQADPVALGPGLLVFS